jgi:hypothetical protein
MPQKSQTPAPIRLFDTLRTPPSAAVGVAPNAARDPGQADVPDASFPSARHAGALPGRPDQPWHPRIDAEPELGAKRPNIPLDQLTVGRAENLLSLIDRWIIEVQGHATEPEPSNEE